MKRLPFRDLQPALALLLSAFFLVLVILPVPVFAARVSRATTSSRVRIGVVRPALAQDVASALFSQQTAYLVELSRPTKTSPCLMASGSACRRAVPTSSGHLKNSARIMISP